MEKDLKTLIEYCKRVELTEDLQKMAPHKEDKGQKANLKQKLGRKRDGKFHAKNILVKCPSKYQEEGIQT